MKLAKMLLSYSVHAFPIHLQSSTCSSMSAYSWWVSWSLQTCSAPRWREEALLPAGALRLDVSEGARASLDCRHRRVCNQDAHQHEKKPSHFSKRYEIFIPASVSPLTCRRLTGFVEGRLFTGMDAVVKREHHPRCRMRTRHVLSVGFSVFFFFINGLFLFFNCAEQSVHCAAARSSLAE